MLLYGCIGFVLGYAVYEWLSAPGTGQPNRFDAYVQETLGVDGFSTSLRRTVHVGGRRLHVHVHHWVYLLVGALLSWTTVVTGPAIAVLVGFCLGGCLQGMVKYDDRWHVCWFEPSEEQRVH